jgi:HD-GYP domain-containing protein (c-di-GMP phosphodiesterase class II)
MNEQDPTPSPVAWLDALGALVWSVGEGGATEYGAQWRAYTGLPPGEEWLGAVHPEDRERAAALRPGGRVDLRLRDARGEHRWFQVDARALAGGGWVGLAVDVDERRRFEDAARLQDQHAEALLRLAKRLERAESREEVVEAAEESVRAATGYKVVWIYLIGRDLDYADVYVGRGPALDPTVSRLSVHGDRMMEEIVAAPDIVVVEDARTDPRTDKAIVARLGNRTVVNVPIVLPGRRLGSLGTGTFGDEGVLPPSPPVRSFLSALASHVAVALDRVSSGLQRRAAEEALRSLNRTLRTLSFGNQALVRAASEEELLSRMCQVLVEHGGYKMTWIGLADVPGAEPSPHAFAGREDGYLQIRTAHLMLGGTDLVTLSACAAGAPRVVHDVTDCPSGPCREAALKRGYRAAAALPLRDGDRVIGALTLYSGDNYAYEDGEMRLLAELAEDISYGILALRVRRDRERSVARLEAAMGAVTQALGSMVELRDPYTAGHQRRVADLSAAIARALGFDETHARALHVAGSVHDVGKIYVPAEILTRPGRLTRVEFEMVKPHVAAGYEILKPIAFDFPLAEIVRQHHERLDGSGYPQGLEGDEILLDARILTVADVVEAMTNHRPYRAALGVEAALAEILQGRGKQYDEAVVDACVALFREGRFSFS